MSSPATAIAIPPRKHKELRRTSDSLDSIASSSASSPRVFAASYSSYGSVSSPSSSPSQRGSRTRRSESLMSAAFCQAEHTVINVGGEERVQLITCVKASQGFDWNQEMFLPSSYHTDRDLERRPDPVDDIVLTEEEIKGMLPS